MINKYAAAIVILFLAFGCKKQSKAFNYFEMSYSSGWTGGYSFAVNDSAKFYYRTIDGVIKGALSDSEFEVLKQNITAIRKADIRSETLSCCDGSAYAFIIKDPFKTYHVIKNGGPDELHNTEKTIKQIIKQRKSVPSDIRYNFKTQGDLIQMPPIPHK